MSQAATQDNSLMSLVARAWQLDAGVEETVFDFDNKTVAFLTSAGAVALAPAADPESAQNRSHIQGGDVGRITISPRTKPTMPLIKFSAPESFFVLLQAGRNGGFVAATASGQIYQIAIDGQVTVLGSEKYTEPKALGTSPANQNVAILCERQIIVLDSDGTCLASVELEQTASDLALHPDGKHLAIADDGGITIWSIGQTLQKERRFEHPAKHVRIAWSPNGRFIATALTEGGLQTWRLSDGLPIPMSNYPSPSRHFNWGPKDSFLATSGAFRIVCWPLSDPDLSKPHPAPFETGTKGLVLVTATAAQKKRNLVAGGYDNGIVVICQAGKPDELILRGVDGYAVRALAWSNDGLSLAIGTAGGFTAVARFPDYMFK